MNKLIKLLCFSLMTHVSLSAQTNINDALTGIVNMLYSDIDYSAEVLVKFYNDKELLLDSESSVVHKKGTQLYRKQNGNELLVNDTYFIRVNHNLKRITVKNSTISKIHMANLGFDTEWMNRKDLEFIDKNKQEFEIRVPSYASYEEVIFTFDKSNFCPRAISYKLVSEENQEISRVDVLYGNQRVGDSVATIAVSPKDYIVFNKKDWSSQLKEYRLVNSFK